MEDSYYLTALGVNSLFTYPLYINILLSILSLIRFLLEVIIFCKNVISDSLDLTEQIL